jgi:hypothetical protein
MNLTEFVAANAITINTEWKSRQLEDDREVDVWAVTLHVIGFLPGYSTPRIAEDRTMDLPMRMGQGLQGRAPTAVDVLECILSDIAAVENANGFNDWLSEFHLDNEEMSVAEIKKLHKTYEDIQAQAAELAVLLGDAYDTALWHLDQD